MSGPRSLTFGHLEIEYDDRVLEPRPWTEAQSTWAASLLPTAPEGPVLELCSGAGHIGLLAVAIAPRHLVCVDANPAACEWIRANAAAAGLDEVEVREGRIDEVLRPDERFAMVIADPPWVPTEETSRFPDDPLLAIDGGVDGLVVAWECVRAAERHLLPGGSAILQVGTRDQADAVRHATRHGPLRVVEVRGFERGTLVRLDRR